MAGSNTVKINSAICFILFSACALIYPSSSIPLSKKKTLLLVLSGIGCLIGGFSIIENVFDIDLIHGKCSNFIYSKEIYTSGRMGIFSGTGYFLLGIYYLFALNPAKPVRTCSQYFIHLVMLLTIAIILGYLFDVPGFYRFTFQTATSLPSAIFMLILAFNTATFHSRLSIFGVYWGKGIMSRNARKVALTLVSIVILLTYLFVALDGYQLFNEEYEFALFGLFLVVIILTIIAFNVREIAQVNISREKAERETVRISQFLNATPDPMFIIRLSGQISHTNARACELLGFSQPELKNLNFFKLSQLPMEYLRELQATADTGAPLLIENYLNTKSGERIEVESSISFIQQTHERLVFIMARDIRQRKIQDQKVNHLASIVLNSKDAIISKSLDGKVLSWNSRAEAIFGYRESEVIGQNLTQLFPDHLDKLEPEYNEKLLRAKETVQYETILSHKNGSPVTVNITLSPIFDQQHNIVAVSKLIRDITQQKQQESIHQRLEKILERSSEIALIGTWEVEPTTRKISWSKIARAIFELPDDFVVELSSIDVYYKKGARYEQLLRHIDTAISEGKPYDIDVQIVSHNGIEKWIRIIGEADFVDGKCLRRYGIIQDITSIKTIQEQLRIANFELNAILNAGGVSIITTDLEGIITHFNHGAELLLHYSAEEVIGKCSPELIHVKSEMEERGKVLSEYYQYPVTGFDIFIHKAKKGEYEVLEWTYVRKDKSCFPVQLIVSPIYNEQGELSGYMGVGTDITELKQVENEMKTLLTITREQNNRLRNFAHIISHNLRSHTSNFEMILNLFSEENKQLNNDPYLQMLHQSSSKLKETINNLNEVVLLNSSEKQELYPIQLVEITESAIANVKQLIANQHIAITNNIPSSVYVMGISAYLDSILINLITNAIKYRNPQVASYVRITVKEEADWVVLQVCDNGLGIDLNRHGAKLFGMYKTFHHHKDARGIGLFLIKNQVEALGGKITVNSEPGIGSCFKVYLQNEAR